MKKLIAIAVAVVCLLTMSTATPVSASAGIHVYPGESIQAAVDAASSGDTIIVHKGEYHESVKITTDNITLKGVGKVFLDGTDVDPVSLGDMLAILGIWISSGVTGVKITGFEIRDYGSWEELQEEPFYIVEELGVGIWMEKDSYDNIVTGNKLSNCFTGIMASTSDDNIIEKNKVYGGIVGIVLERESHNNEVENNVIKSAMVGIGVDEASAYNIIEKNKVSNSGIGGIWISGNFKENRIFNTDHNEVINNKVTDSGQFGIALASYASDNLIKGNKVSSSGTYDLCEIDLTGTGNVWEDNKFETFGIIESLPLP